MHQVGNDCRKEEEKENKRFHKHWTLYNCWLFIVNFGNVSDLIETYIQVSWSWNHQFLRIQIRTFESTKNRLYKK